MNNVYLSLGSNEGDRVLWLKKALRLLSANCGTIIKHSSVYETAAWGKTDQPDFLNMVVLLETSLQPMELLAKTQEIEIALGRQRSIKWGPRTLDIDILFYNHLVATFPGLTLPHPYIQERRFTLLPLNEMAPGFIHPVLNKSIADLLDLCPDTLEVKATGDISLLMN